MLYQHRIAAIKRVGTYLLAQGIAPANVLRQLNLPASLLLEDDIWLDRRSSLQLSLEIARCTGDGVAGLHVAEIIQFTDYGLWGHGIQSARSLRDAIEFACREIQMIETGTRLRLREEGSLAHFSTEFLGPLGHDPQQHMEGHLLVLRKILSLAVEHIPAVAHLPYPRRSKLDMGPWFGERLEFLSDHAELVFDRGALQLPLLPLRHPISPRGPDSTARGVMNAVSQLLEFERPTAQAVAAALDINLRTMQRHLNAWGISFEDLLDQHRQRMAWEHLQSGAMSITDIAFRLGYSDSAHFSRAFRRWTGLSPRQASVQWDASRAEASQDDLAFESAAAVKRGQRRSAGRLSRR